MIRTFIVENTFSLPEQCLRDLFKLRDSFGYDCEDPKQTMEEFKDYCLFNTDYFEHTCSWMNNAKALEILKKHKVTGSIILDSEGSIFGWKFVDGELQSQQPALVWK